MKYILTPRTLTSKKPVDISEAEFTAIKKARDTLLTATNVEEKYDLVVENYSEYERELLGLTVSWMLHRDFQWSSFASARYVVARRLANVLTVARSYEDQVKQDVQRASGDDGQRVLVQKFAEEYDGSLGYRTMAALRNYLQHGGFPFKMTLRTTWNDDRTRCQFVIIPLLEMSQLRGSSFKSAVRQQLDAFVAEKGEPNVTLFLRQFIEGLNRVHVHVRASLAEHVQHAQLEFGHVITRAREHFEGQVPGLAAVALDGGGHEQEVVAVFQDILDRRFELERMNRELPTLSSWYASGEIPFT